MRYWSYELYRHGRGLKPRLWWAIAKCIKWRMILQGIFSVIVTSIYIGQPVCITYLSNYFTIADPTPSDTHTAYALAAAVALLSFLLATANGIRSILGYKAGMIVRILATGAVYNKVLSLSQSVVSNLTIGHIVNLASNDVHRLNLSLLTYHFLWITPLHLIVVTYFIYSEIGPTAFLAAFLVIAQVPFEIVMAKLYAYLRLKTAKITDKRIKIMNEVITGIRVIKMYGWEHAFSRLIADIRKTEVNTTFKSLILRAINVSYYFISLPTIMFVVFSIYSSVGGTPTTRNVFATLSHLIYVRVTVIIHMVEAIVNLSEGSVALKRIKKYLLTQELQNVESHATQDVSIDTSAPVGNDLDVKDDEATPPSGVTVNELYASWTSDPQKLVLDNISFTVNKDKPLLAVVGPVGSGKSALLQCLLGELPSLRGDVTVRGRVAYASQEPWVFSASLRENVLFGCSYDPSWYSTVLEACALDKDIDLLPHGDQTLVGERGATLSGGQKARVNLARAIYHRADVYLLDDPLSAVDAAVSRHIFDRCICGLLSDSCVVLVTHQLQYVQQCDQVLGLKEGRVLVYGDPSQENIIELMEEKDESEDDPRNVYKVRKHSIIPPPTTNEVSVRGTLTSVEEECKDGEKNSNSVYPLIIQDSIIQNSHTEGNEDIPHQLSVEERAVGQITVKTYYKYFKTGGGYILSIIVVLLFFLGEGSNVTANWWISDWATCDSERFTNKSTCSLGNRARIGAYGGIICAVLVLNVARTVSFYVVCLRSARILHDTMFKAVLRAPILFFDTNPVGRILNRFSKDVGFLDDLLIFIFCEFVQFLGNFFSVMITAIVANYYLSIVVVILFVILLSLRWYYIRAAREIKRLEALARSPLYSHLSMTLQGLPTIRSYHMQQHMIDQFHHHHNNHTQAWYLYIASSRWLGYRIENLSSLFISVVALLAVPLSASIDPGLIGLSLVYAISLNDSFQYCVRQSTEVESLMVSAERVMAYGKLESEAPLETHPPNEKPPSDWPKNGEITVSNLSYHHADTGPLVLKDINFKIKAGEKIGIVGRTGAGKSSLVSSFFRLAEPMGSIVIDGIECLGLGLHDVRTSISIIPQDPVLFSGTVRYNVDPFSIYDDGSIWRALEQVQLKTVVENLDMGLDSLVSEGGSNFSVGQKQLFCLARALLRQNKILVLDEATANVDLETDAIIQEVISDQFSHCTVLTIAHRLDTVMDSDRIMALRRGEVIEFDEPHVLLSIPSSYLSRLVDHTGPVAAANLRTMAQTAYNHRREPNKLSL